MDIFNKDLNEIGLSERLTYIMLEISTLKKLENQRPLNSDECKNLNDLVSQKGQIIGILHNLSCQSVGTLKGFERQRRYKYLLSGSFDPFTYGHLSILSSLLETEPDENIVIGIAVNPDKRTLFSPYDKKFLIQSYIQNCDQHRVKIDNISGPTKIYMNKNAIPHQIRGVRDLKDFGDETALTKLNHKLPGKGLNSMIAQAEDKLSAVSSSNLKLLVDLGIPLDDYASAFTREVLKMKTSKKLVIGVVGGIASGKSSVCSKLAEYSNQRDVNVYYLDMDKYGHKILNDTEDVCPMYECIRDKVAKEFGQALQNPDGTIDRKALGSIVFRDKEKLQKLNQIMFEPGLVLLSEELSSCGEGIILMENAALLAYGLTEICDENILNIRVSPQVQLERLQKRNNMSLADATDRLESQPSQQEIISKINQKHSKEFDRLYMEVNTDCNIEDINISNIYSNLEKEYFRRKEVRRFGKLFIPEEITFDNDRQFIQTITEKYCEEHRYYHNINHIEDMLIWFQKVKESYQKNGSKLPYANEIYLAVMFHDYIYDIDSKDGKSNEEENAEFAYDYLKKHLKTENVDINVVCKLINLTASHGNLDFNAEVLEEFEKVFLDMDMAVFSSDKDKLFEYENSIYNEYASKYSRDQYIEGRREVLWNILQKRSIYGSKFFKEKYDSKAWQNIKYLIDFLYREQFA